MYDAEELDVVFSEGHVVEVVQDADHAPPSTGAAEVHGRSSSGGSGHANAVRTLLRIPAPLLLK